MQPAACAAVLLAQRNELEAAEREAPMQVLCGEALLMSDAARTGSHSQFAQQRWLACCKTLAHKL